MILYWPSASLTTDRTFSMSAGLAASTVTPGITAPEGSRTTPAIPPAPCALARVADAQRTPTSMMMTLALVDMFCLPLDACEPLPASDTTNSDGSGETTALPSIRLVRACNLSERNLRSQCEFPLDDCS